MKQTNYLLLFFCIPLLLVTTGITSIHIFHRNYVFFSSSPNHLYTIIGIPDYDINKTEGVVYAINKKTQKKVTCFSIEDYEESVFIVSDSTILFQIEADLENTRIDPVFDWKIKVYLPHVEKAVTYYNTTRKDLAGLTIPSTFSLYTNNKHYRKYSSGFNRKKFNTPAISFKGDSLKISDLSQVYHEDGTLHFRSVNCYYSLSTGTYLGLNVTYSRSIGYQSIPFELVLMNGKERSELAYKMKHTPWE